MFKILLIIPWRIVILYINGIEPSNHYFSMLTFLIIKKYFPHKHYKCLDRYRWIVFYNREYFGLLTNFTDKTVKIFHKGACIQYFTSLADLDIWIKNGCSKQTLFMMKEK